MSNETDPGTVDSQDAQSVTQEQIAAAIKATEYKYFGDYEMSDDQRDAVDVLVRVAQARLASQPTSAEDALAWPDIGPDPMKGPREPDQNEKAVKRVEQAYVIQQKEVPDQTALVWRWDIGRLLMDYRRLLAWQESQRSRPTPDTQTAAIGAEAMREALEIVTKLQPLMEAATPGPYRAHDHNGMSRVGANPADWIGYGWVGRITPNSGPNGSFDAGWLNADRRKDADKEYRERASADVYYVAAALNAMPRLIELLSQPVAAPQAEMVERLRNSIEALGEQGIGSNVSMSYAFACDVLAALSTPPQPEGGTVALKPGDATIYDTDGYDVQTTFVRYVEGWCEVSFRDGSTAIVRPSRIRLATLQPEKTK